MKRYLFILLIVILNLGLTKSAYADGPYEKLPSGSGVVYHTDTSAVCSDEQTVMSKTTNRKLNDCSKYDDPDGNPIVCANDNGVVGCYVKKPAPAAPISGSTTAAAGQFCKQEEPNKVFHNERDLVKSGVGAVGCAAAGAAIGLPLGGPIGAGLGALIGTSICGVGGALIPQTQEFTGILTPVGVDCPEGQVCIASGDKASCGNPPAAESGPSQGQAPGITSGGSSQQPSGASGFSICSTQSKANVNGNRGKDCFICQGNTIIGVRPDGSQYTQSQCASNQTCQPIDAGDLISDVACATKVTVKPPINPLPPAPVAAPAVQCGGACIYSQKDTDGVVRCYAGNCKNKSATCGFNDGNCGYDPQCTVIKQVNCPGTASPVAPSADGTAPAGGSAPASCNRGEVPTGNRYLDANQTNCLLNFRKDIVPQYIKDGWCSDDENKQHIAIDWYFKLASPVEKAQVTKECPNIPAEGGTQAARTTTKFRLATNPTDLETATWHDYTAGGVTVNIPSAGYFSIDTSFGTKSIYVQFMDNNNQKIKFSSGNDFTVVNIDLVDIASLAPQAPAAGGQTAEVKCTGTNVNGSGVAGGTASMQFSYSGTPNSMKIWLASNSDLGKAAAGVTSWTAVLADNAQSGTISFKIPPDMQVGSHAVLVSLHDQNGAMLDGNPGGVVSPTCTSAITIQSAAGSVAPPAPPTEAAVIAKCSGVSVISSAGGPGGVGTVQINYSGNPSFLRIWVASNSDVGKSASEVSSWTLVRADTVPEHTLSFNIPSDMQSGSHAIMVSLHAGDRSMLDGNPGGVVSSQCTSTINVQ